MHSVISTRLCWSVALLRAALWVGRAADLALKCGLGGGRPGSTCTTARWSFLRQTVWLSLWLTHFYKRKHSISHTRSPCRKKNRTEVDGVSGVQSLLIHKGPEWPFNTQIESLFAGCVQTLVLFSFWRKYIALWTTTLGSSPGFRGYEKKSCICVMLIWLQSESTREGFRLSEREMDRGNLEGGFYLRLITMQITSSFVQTSKAHEKKRKK